VAKGDAAEEFGDFAAPKAAVADEPGATAFGDMSGAATLPTSAAPEMTTDVGADDDFGDFSAVASVTSEPKDEPSSAAAFEAFGDFSAVASVTSEPKDEPASATAAFEAFGDSSAVASEPKAEAEPAAATAGNGAVGDASLPGDAPASADAENPTTAPDDDVSLPPTAADFGDFAAAVSTSDASSDDIDVTRPGPPPVDEADVTKPGPPPLDDSEAEVKPGPPPLDDSEDEVKPGPPPLANSDAAESEGQAEGGSDIFDGVPGAEALARDIAPAVQLSGADTTPPMSRGVGPGQLQGAGSDADVPAGSSQAQDLAPDSMTFSSAAQDEVGGTNGSWASLNEPGSAASNEFGESGESGEFGEVDEQEGKPATDSGTEGAMDADGSGLPAQSQPDAPSRVAGDDFGELAAEQAEATAGDDFSQFSSPAEQAEATAGGDFGQFPSPAEQGEATTGGDFGDFPSPAEQGEATTGSDFDDFAVPSGVGMATSAGTEENGLDSVAGKASGSATAASDFGDFSAPADDPMPAESAYGDSAGGGNAGDDSSAFGNFAAPVKEAKGSATPRTSDFGDFAAQGDGADFGDFAAQGDGADFGDFAAHGDGADFGDFAAQGDGADFGDFAAQPTEEPKGLKPSGFGNFGGLEKPSEETAAGASDFGNFADDFGGFAEGGKASQENPSGDFGDFATEAPEAEPKVAEEQSKAPPSSTQNAYSVDDKIDPGDLAALVRATLVGSTP
jgi:hypothetical protein